MRGILPRLHIFRTIAPRVARPLLPLTATTRAAVSPLTCTPRHARLFSNFPARLMADSNPKPPSEPHLTLPPDASMSQRLKHLITAYGWYALGIYLVIGVLDFTVAFVGINLLGAEYVSEVAASVKGMVTDFIYTRPVEPGRDEIDALGKAQTGTGKEGLYAMIVLAYTIHKTLFLPLRVGLTAAFTPKIVGWLSARGWAGSAGTRRAAHEMRERIRERGHKNSNP